MLDCCGFSPRFREDYEDNFRTHQTRRVPATRINAVLTF
jgi:hypothetical protein